MNRQKRVDNRSKEQYQKLTILYWTICRGCCSLPTTSIKIPFLDYIVSSQEQLSNQIMKSGTNRSHSLFSSTLILHIHLTGLQLNGFITVQHPLKERNRYNHFHSIPYMSKFLYLRTVISSMYVICILLLSCYLSTLRRLMHFCGYYKY